MLIWFFSRLEPVDVSRSEPTEHDIRHDCSGHLPSAKIGVAQETIAEEEDEGNTDEQEISSRHVQCMVQSSSSTDEANPPALEQGTCSSETSRQHPRQPIPKVCIYNSFGMQQYAWGSGSVAPRLFACGRRASLPILCCCQCTVLAFVWDVSCISHLLPLGGIYTVQLENRLNKDWELLARMVCWPFKGLLVLPGPQDADSRR